MVHSGDVAPCTDSLILILERVDENAGLETFIYIFNFNYSFPDLRWIDTNFANLAITSLSPFVIMNINFCSSEVNESKCLLLCIKAFYNSFLSLEYKGHFTTKWSSVSMSSIHIKHFLSCLGNFGLKCLPVSIRRLWFDSLRRVKAILCLTFLIEYMYFSKEALCLNLQYEIAFGLSIILTFQYLS